MHTHRTDFDSGTAYPGEFTPKRQMLRALAESYGNEKDSMYPEVDIRETPEYYKIELTVPGLKRENLLVNIDENGNLCIFGYQKGSDKMISQYGYREKMTFQSFKKEIALPDYVDPSFNSAQCQGGLLSILFTKSDKPVKRGPATVVVY